MKKIITTAALVLLVLAAVLVAYFLFRKDYRANYVNRTQESTVPDEYQEGTFLLGKQLDGERIFHGAGSATKISPDGRRYWNIVFNKQGERIGAREFIDGKEIRSYTISSGYPMDPHRADIIVSFNNQQAGYIVLSDKPGGYNEWYVIINGVENGPYRRVGKFSLTPQDKIAYVASKNDTSYLIVSEKQVGPEGIIDFQYSPDGEHLVYAVEDDNRNTYLSLDGKEIGYYDYVSNFTFSPDSKRFAYVVREGNKVFVVVDGKRHKSYGFIDNLSFSPDGSKLVYSASDEPNVSSEKSVLNGKEGPDYLWIFQYVFSPDSVSLAYDAQKKLTGVKNESNVVLNDRVVEIYPGKEHGKEGNWAYDRNFIGNLVFSPDSKYLAYTVTQSKTTSSALNPYEKFEFIIVNGRKKEVTYDSVSNLAFTSDGKYIRYNGMKGSKIYLVVEKY